MKLTILALLLAVGTVLADGNDASSEGSTGAVDYPVLKLGHHKTTAQVQSNPSVLVCGNDFCLTGEKDKTVASITIPSQPDLTVVASK